MGRGDAGVRDVTRSGSYDGNFKIAGRAKLALGAAFMAIAAVIVAIYEAQSARTATAALSAITHERDSLRMRLTLQAPEPRTARAPRTETGPKPTVVTEAATVQHATSASPLAPAVASKRDPARLAQYHRRFDAFVRERGLTPEQAEQLFEILGDWEDVSRDFQASIREQGLTARPEAQKLRDRLQRQIEVEPLVALLGEDGKRAYFDFESNSFYRAIIEPFAQTLTVVDLALTDDQAGKLIALVKSNMHTVKRDPTAMGSEVVVAWTQVLAAAGGILDPKQMTALQAQVARQNAGR